MPKMTVVLVCKHKERTPEFLYPEEPYIGPGACWHGISVYGIYPDSDAAMAAIDAAAEGAPGWEWMIEDTTW